MLPDKNQEKHYKKNNYLKPQEAPFILLCLPLPHPLSLCDSLLLSTWLGIYVGKFRLKAYYLNPTLAKQSAVYILKCELFSPQQGSIYVYDSCQVCISPCFLFSFRRKFWRKYFFLTPFFLNPELLEFQHSLSWDSNEITLNFNNFESVTYMRLIPRWKSQVKMNRKPATYQWSCCSVLHKIQGIWMTERVLDLLKGICLKKTVKTTQTTTKNITLEANVCEMEFQRQRL